MSTTMKLVLSILGTFITGAGAVYAGNPNASLVALFFGGAVPVGGYLLGLFQLKPGQV